VKLISLSILVSYRYDTDMDEIPRFDLSCAIQIGNKLYRWQVISVTVNSVTDRCQSIRWQS